MASAPPAVRRALKELDAEARAVLARWPLPVRLYLYRRAKGPAVVQDHRRPHLIFRNRDALSMLTALVEDPERLNPTARYIAQLWMAGNRCRLAKRRNDREAQRAAEVLWEYLLAHPPSADRGARNIVQHNESYGEARKAEWQRWQAEANLIWADRPLLSATAVGELVKTRLRLKDHPKSIARRLTKPKKK